MIYSWWHYVSTPSSLCLKAISHSIFKLIVHLLSSLVTYNTLENIQLPFYASLTNKWIDHSTLGRGRERGQGDFEKYPSSIIVPEKFMHTNHVRSVSRNQNMLINGPENIHPYKKKISFLLHERIKEIEPVINHSHNPSKSDNPGLNKNYVNYATCLAVRDTSRGWRKQIQKLYPTLKINRTGYF